MNLPITMPRVQNMLAERSLRPEHEQIRLNIMRHLFLKRRWQGAAMDGTEFEFDLKSRLKDGCVIFQTDQADYVVSQMPESVFQIPLSSAGAAALIGWRIGNLHFPVQIADGFLRVSQDPAIAQLLEREGLPYEEATVVFNPLKAMPHAIGTAAANASTGTDTSCPDTGSSDSIRS